MGAPSRADPDLGFVVVEDSDDVELAVLADAGQHLAGQAAGADQQ